MPTMHSMIVTDERLNDRFLRPQAAHQQFPRVHAVRRVVVGGDVGDLVLAELDALVGDDLGRGAVRPPGPITIGEEAFGEFAVVAWLWDPELHHHVVNAAFLAGDSVVLAAV